MLNDLAHWMTSFASSPYGAVALFFFAFAESSFFPIPPDILLIPLALNSPKVSFLYAGICLLGSVLGGIFGYLIGDFGGKRLLNRIINKEKLKLVKHYYHRYDVWAVSIAALTPIPYKIFTISAGFFNLNFYRFIIASILGRGGRFFAVGLVIFIFGERVKAFLDKYFDLAMVIFTILLIGGFVFVNQMAKRFNKK